VTAGDREPRPAARHVALVVLTLSCPIDVVRRQAIRRALEAVEPGLLRARGAVVRGAVVRGTAGAGATQLRWRVTTAVRRGHDPEGAWSAGLALAAWTLVPEALVATVLADPEDGRRYVWRWTPDRRGDAEKHAAWRPFAR
jgi:hypothetical protein